MAVTGCRRTRSGRYILQRPANLCRFQPQQGTLSRGFSLPHSPVRTLNKARRRFSVFLASRLSASHPVPLGYVSRTQSLYTFIF